jgi:hypothetical protein
MYCATILTAHTMASKIEPKAIEPMWYRTSHQTLVPIGDAYCSLEDLKYQIAVDDAMMKWEQARRKLIAHRRANPCR